MKTQSSFVLFCTMILLLPKLDAQWSRTSGPSGGLVLTLQSNDQYLFAGARNGVYRSSDDGNNWERLSKGLPFSFLCHDLDAQGDNVLFFGEDYIKKWSGSFRYQVYKSNTSGDQWKEIPVPDTIYFPTQVAIHDSFIFLSDQSLLRSTDDGETWIPLLTWAHDSFSYCRQLEIYNDRLFVIGLHKAWITDDWGEHWEKIFFPDYCLGYNLFPLDSLLILACEDEAYRSIDNGKTWQQATGWQDGFPIYKDIYFQNDTFYTAGKENLLRSVDFGQSWEPVPPDTSSFYPLGLTIHQGQIYACSPSLGVQRFRPEADTLQITDYGIDATFVLSLTVHDDELWAGVEDYGLFKYDIPNQTWDKKNFFPDPYGVIEITWFEDYLFIINFFGQVFRSSDIGQTWKQVFQIDFGGRAALVVINNAIYVIDEYLGISKSNDYGDSWEPAFPKFEEPINSFHWSFVQHHESFFLISLNNQLFISSDAGESWLEVSTGIDFHEKFIKRIWSEGPYLLLEVYDGDHTGDDELILYKSIDNGLTWSLFTEGLPIIKSFAADHVQEINFVFYSDTLLISSYSQGIFYNTIQDPIWKPLMVEDKFPRFTTALALDDKKVFVGIGGMGVWQMNTNGFISKTNKIQPPFNSLLVLPNPASEEITFQVDRDATEGMVFIFDMQGKVVLIKRINGLESISIPVRHLPTGKYSLKFETHDQLYLGNFIKN